MPRTQCRNRHVPDGLSPRTGTGWAAQAPNAGRVRPSTGARCGKAARRDLRGGAGGNSCPYRDTFLRPTSYINQKASLACHRTIHVQHVAALRDLISAA